MKGSVGKLGCPGNLAAAAAFYITRPILEPQKPAIDKLYIVENCGG